MAVYPVSPYRAIWEAAGDPFVADTLAALDNLLAKRPAEPRAPLPGLPLRNAVNDFAAQVAYLDLPDGGRGVRFVGRFAQDAAPLRNDQLRYVFQGLIADGIWLVVASLPISTAALPQDTEVAVVDPVSLLRTVRLATAIRTRVRSVNPARPVTIRRAENRSSSLPRSLTRARIIL